MRVDGLDDKQLAAVMAPRGPVCVLAGAGTGKTRTITHRIARLIDSGQVAPSQVLAVTFTARAAGEMRGRLRTLGVEGTAAVQALTFHAAARRQLVYFWPRAVGATQWELLTNKFPLLGRAARSVHLDTSTETVRDLGGEIEWAKATRIGPDDYAAAAALAGRDTPAPVEQVAQAYAAYEKLRHQPDGNVLLDFDDLLITLAGIMQEYPDIAEEFRDRYRSFVVDEYQDVTPVQQALLDEWLGPRDDLTVVGDANQTIYSFNGATPSYLLNFTRTFPDATLVRLENDYRSTPEVVALANRVIEGARGREAGARLRLIGQRPSGPAPLVAEYPDEPTEAVGVATAITRLIRDGVPASEIAILYRINAQSLAFEQALDAAGVPYQVRGGESFFDRAEVRQAMRDIATAAARRDLPDDADPLRVLAAVLAPLGLAEEPPTGVQARARWESLRAIVGVADELSADPDFSLRTLSEELRTRAENRHPPSVAGVTLSSLHAAKGLEWDAVFIVGLVEGSVPISQAIAKGDTEIEEERRLLYVGVTRAREHLRLSWAQTRNSGGKRPRKRSRFLDRVAPAAPRDTARPTESRKRSDPAAGLNDADRALFEDLRRWRKGLADENDQPPFIIATNAMLLQIAERRPQSPATLGAIDGIGPHKIATFGADILAVVSEHSGK